MSTRDGMTLAEAEDVQTAPLVALGLVGGYLVARESGIRPLGGLLLGGCGLLAGRTWYARGGAGAAGMLAGTYLAAFGLSHPLAKRIGAWPAVGVVTAVAAGAAYAGSDAR